MPISGVPVEIAAAARAGKTRFDISLDPIDLGRIDVRINVDRNGQVTSHLTVEKPETLQMLRQDAPQLQRALDDAGLKTGSNGLSFSLRDQNSSGQNSGQNNDNGGNARRLISAKKTPSPPRPSAAATAACSDRAAASTSECEEYSIMTTTNAATAPSVVSGTTPTSRTSSSSNSTWARPPARRSPAISRPS